MLYSRDEVLGQIRKLSVDAGEGRGSALVILGAPGEGKSAVLGAAEQIVGKSWRKLRCHGVRHNAEQAFTGLQLMFAPAPDDIDPLPNSLRDALPATFDVVSTESAAAPHRVGLATLSALAELSAVAPVLCLIDDVQWLDQPSIDALLFAANRLGTSRVVMLFTARPGFLCRGVPQIPLGPLAPESARTLLIERASNLAGCLREKIFETAAGNPLALVELPSVNSDPFVLGQLALTDRLQAEYQNSILELPEDARLALLIAAADNPTSIGVVAQVLAEFGLTAAALDDAERAGVITISGLSLVFRHPLERAAAYRVASFSQRLAVHAAIAVAHTDSPSLRARHLAAAATGPNELAAAALEDVARRAYHRPEYAIAPLAAERASRLSPRPADRLRRLLLAFDTADETGHTTFGLAMADKIADFGYVGPRLRARKAVVRARAESAQGHPQAAHAGFSHAADLISSAEPETAARLLIYAAEAAWSVPDSARVAAMRAKLGALNLGEDREAFLDLLDGPLALDSGDHAHGARMIRGNLDRVRTLFADDAAIQHVLAVQAISVGDMQVAHSILLDLDRSCRDRGIAGMLPAVCSTLGSVEMLTGQFRTAAAAFEESRQLAQDLEQPYCVDRADSRLAVLAAISGDQDRCRELAEHSRRRTATCYDPINAAFAEWALGLLDLGCGRYEEAADRLEELIGSVGRVRAYWVNLMSDCVEATVRLGDPARAAVSISVLEHWQAANPTPWIEGHVLRCRGLLEQDDAVLARALTLHARSRHWFDHARTGLLYGERLRRGRSKTKARSVLRDAMDTFARLGAGPWTERARTELRAAGEATEAKLESKGAMLLTPQELQIVRLAATGATNKEIGAQLRLSPKTVAHHLYRAFPKLGVSNRRTLARVPLDLDGSASI